MTVHLADLTWPEVKAEISAGAVVVLPVGAMEQHGLHMPLETDWRLVSEVAARACTLAGQEGTRALVTPPIWTGFSPHHMDFPGSVTLEGATFISLVSQVCNSLWHHGFRKILVLNGHGGNMNLLRSAVQQMRFEQGVSVATASYWDFAVPFVKTWRRSELGGINHACEMETALMLALREHLVHLDRIKERPYRPRSSYLGADLTAGGTVTVARAFAEFAPDGVAGSPELATRERGVELLDEIVRQVALFLREFNNWEMAPGQAVREEGDGQ